MGEAVVDPVAHGAGAVQQNFSLLKIYLSQFVTQHESYL